MKQRILSNILTAVLPLLMILVLIVPGAVGAQEPGVTPSDAACPGCQSPPQGGADSTLQPEEVAAAPGKTGYDQVVLTDQDEGDQVTLAAGQLLVVSLAANYSTGYRWQVAELDATVLQLVGQEYIQGEAEPGMTGVPGQQILRFSALRAGQTPLRLAYRRSWETVPPLDTFSSQVEAEGPGPRLEPEKPAVPPAAPPAEDSSPAGPSQLPGYWNWCDGGCTPIKDQGACGSCWAFATTGTFESAIKIRYGVTRGLSEQYLISCNMDNWGCKGGGVAHKYHYDVTPPGEAGPGARYEGAFPYAEKEVPCNPPHTPHEKLCGFADIFPYGVLPDPEKIKEAIYYAGPVYAAVCVGDAFQDYDGGIFATDESALCENSGKLTNHAIVLVGWDDATGTWILKNSWGTRWGSDIMDGYMFIKWGTSNVGYKASYVVYDDPTPPSTSLALYGTTGENGWYASDVQVTLSAEDNAYGGGVALRQYQIDGGDWQSYSGPFWISEGRHTLAYKSQDNCGNWESPQRIPLDLDTVPPSGSITLNRASPATVSAVVRAGLAAHDATSGVAQMRVRDAGGSWTGWQAYDPSIFWQLPNPESGQNHTVQVQFKDVAGHKSVVYNDAITLDIYPARPTSASYRLAKSTWGASGSPASSTQYRLQSTLGQPSMIGLLSSASYGLSSGFWGQALSARPHFRAYLPLVLKNPPPTSNTLFGVWGSSGSDVFAVGEAGTIVHYDGTDWRAVSSGTTKRLYGVWGSSGSDVLAVGWYEGILRYDGASWSEVSSGTGPDFRGVWGSSGSDVFAVGDGGTIVHYNGAGWSAMSSGTTDDLYGVWGSSGSDVFAVGDAGTVLHYDGTDWSAMDSGWGYPLYGVWGSSGSDVFAVGVDHFYGSTILHYDGTAWSVMSSAFFGLRGVWGSRSSDVLAVGQGGAILHYDGAGWSAMSSGTDYILYGVWGSSGSDVFAVGEAGTILHYDGTDWRRP